MTVVSPFANIRGVKSLIRSLIINLAALWVTNEVVACFYFARGVETLIATAFVLGVVNLFVKPLINILLLPINLLTLGTLRWVVNVATLYLVTLIVPDFRVVGFFFPGLAYNGFSLPPFSADGILALILSSFALSFVSGFLFWLAK